MKQQLWGFVFLILSLIWSPYAQADGLIFVYSPGCMYCEQWREDIEPMYHKTEEGKRLPLRSVNLDKGMPQDLSHLLFPAFTPTFIIVDDNNQESGRILGYNTEFFWGFLQEEIRKLDLRKKS